jgi:type-F conjugative transfer system pilin assembly protein TrbC
MIILPFLLSVTPVLDSQTAKLVQDSQQLAQQEAGALAKLFDGKKVVRQETLEGSPEVGKSPCSEGCSKKPLLLGEAQGGEPQEKLGKKTVPFSVCVSFSMPVSTLKALEKDLRPIGGRLVVRGFLNNSLIQTQQLLQTHGLTIDIDPTVFEENDVKEVPTFLHHTDHAVDRLRGNVSVRQALETFADGGSLEAKALLTSLQGEHP